MPPSEANGRILDYEVTLRSGKAPAQHYTVNATRLTVNLTSDRYRATLAARNGVGPSDTATLTIPAYDFQGSCLGAGPRAGPAPVGVVTRSLGVRPPGACGVVMGPETFLAAP